MKPIVGWVGTLWRPWDCVKECLRFEVGVVRSGRDVEGFNTTGLVVRVVVRSECVIDRRR